MKLNEIFSGSYNDTTVILSRIQRIVQDGCRECTEDVTTSEVYPCRLLGSLLAHCLDIKLREFIAFLLPLCGIIITAKNIIQFHT